MPSGTTTTQAMASFVPNNYNMQLPTAFFAKNEKTFQYQEQFPPLPVPNLEETLARYLESTKPHLTDAEFEKTQRIVKDFQTGVGSKLHEKLVEKAKTSRNWIEKWWEDWAYLFLRSPHAPYVNFAGPAPYNDTFWPAKDGTQIERGALGIWFSLKYWEALRREALAVDRGGKTTLWCMHQFKRMFNGCKTPGKDMDKLNDYFKSDAEGTCPSHVVVLCRGRLFTFNAIDSDGQIITAPELEVQYGFVKEQCDKEAAGLGLGSVTGGNRTKWFETRNHLIELSPNNEKSLMTIQTAVLCIVLDEGKPVTQTEIASQGILGDSTNRWFDKALTFVVFSNGTISCNCDHAPHDAMVMVALSLWTHLGVTGNKGTWKGPSKPRPLPCPTEITFKVDDQIVSAVQEARGVHNKNCDDCDVSTGDFFGYGKDKLRKHKIHPDAFVQVALQYSYYKIHGKFAPTYETASARKFYHGRTETVRSCTMESCRFAKAMAERKFNAGQRMKLLVSAVDKHLDWMSVCQEGRGCDRHLFGLSMVAMEEGLPPPDLFTDPAYTKSGGGGNYVLSTSFVGYSTVYGGVLPMCDKGYGFFYAIGKEGMKMFSSSWKRNVETDANVLIEVMKQSLAEMGNLLEEAAAAKL